MSKNNTNSSLNLIKDAIKDLRDGKIIIVVDDEDRENEGDFICCGGTITPEIINFLITNGRGLLCTSISKAKAGEILLAPMVEKNTESMLTNFTVSIDLKGFGCTSGISAPDRAKTIVSLLESDKSLISADSFMRPGHVFPLIANDGGVRARPGHTEAALELSRLAGKGDVGVLIEILKNDGTMCRLPDLLKIARIYDLKIISIADLIVYLNENNIVTDFSQKTEVIGSISFDYKTGETNSLNPATHFSKTESIDLPTIFGNFKMKVYKDAKTNHEYSVVYNENFQPELEKSPESSVAVRLHSSCVTGDIFHSKRCDCGEQLEKSFQQISGQKGGVIIYLPHEGRGIGLFSKIQSYKLQENGLDTVDANLELGFKDDERCFNFSGIILKDMNILNVDLITNNPIKITQLEKQGINVSSTFSLITVPNQHNQDYLDTKKNRMNHIF